jgi:hypothetical protein
MCVRQLKYYTAPNQKLFSTGLYFVESSQCRERFYVTGAHLSKVCVLLRTTGLFSDEPNLRYFTNVISTARKAEFYWTEMNRNILARQISVRSLICVPHETQKPTRFILRSGLFYAAYGKKYITISSDIFIPSEAIRQSAECGRVSFRKETRQGESRVSHTSC